MVVAEAEAATAVALAALAEARPVQLAGPTRPAEARRAPAVEGLPAAAARPVRHCPVRNLAPARTARAQSTALKTPHRESTLRRARRGGKQIRRSRKPNRDRSSQSK